MKAIIFDLDNTLIDWKKEYSRAIKNTLSKLGINEEDALVSRLHEIISRSEEKSFELSLENLLNYVNENIDEPLTMDFINTLLEEQTKCYEKDEELVKVISYLSNKYDLYVITNWFTTVQEKRLENVGIKKYFKKIIGADINYKKPNPKAYDIILDDYPYEECLFIGDNLKNDVIMPLSKGMDAIWITKEDSNDYKTIKSVKELINIL